jgi:hypothetical protein
MSKGIANDLPIKYRLFAHFYHISQNSVRGFTKTEENMSDKNLYEKIMFANNLSVTFKQERNIRKKQADSIPISLGREYRKQISIVALSFVIAF